jgi:hypothetical protein
MPVKHEFVEHIPEHLEEGVIYVSISFGTVVHRCACGCGNEVVTPLSPTDWSLIFDGESISLHPSIGNWSFACQSHYWIRNNEVRWSRKWSKTEIAGGRARDRAYKSLAYAPDHQDRERSINSTGKSTPTSKKGE